MVGPDLRDSIPRRVLAKRPPARPLGLPSSESGARLCSVRLPQPFPGPAILHRREWVFAAILPRSALETRHLRVPSSTSLPRVQLEI